MFSRKRQSPEAEGVQATGGGHQRSGPRTAAPPLDVQSWLSARGRRGTPWESFTDEDLAEGEENVKKRIKIPGRTEKLLGPGVGRRN